ncbi:MAG: 3'-5' exonuclease [Bacteroidales bacterium]|jgi:DNA polymerase-3 subunit epsilon|nr:3'-5' exonuclease [Bacteroidales bacterium]
MELKLERPLVFFDVETTGLSVGKDRIVEIYMLKIMPSGEHLAKTMLINPQVPIPVECSELHGIYDIDVKDKPTFAQVADEIAAFISNSDLAGYNSNKFDIPLLLEEFLRCGKEFDMRDRYTVDVQNIYHRMEPRTLSAAYKFYCHKELSDAHVAESDTQATFDVLMGQLKMYENAVFEDKDGQKSIPITGNVKDLSSFSTYSRFVDFAGHIIFNEYDEEVFNFGKYKGKTVEWVFRKEPPYYDWMMKADFPLYTKKIITKIRNRIF